MISCDRHDYIEIACLYHYPVKLTVKEGGPVLGRAIDTQYNEHRVECIKVESEGADRLVELASILTMEACTANPHFKVVSFT